MTREELFAADERLDIQVCGRSLAAAGPTRFAADGAHDPTPTPYFVLDELLGGLSLGRGDHLLDVGCGRGRVLAYAARRFPAARVTGVELDPALAEYASSWSEGIPGVSVRRGSALGLSLAPYTHFYLFNPFDTPVLERFLFRLEREVRSAVDVIHLSDNGETHTYLVRSGWRLVREGSVQAYRTPAGHEVVVYAHPQHWSHWRYEP